MKDAPSVLAIETEVSLGGLDLAGWRRAPEFQAPNPRQEASKSPPMFSLFGIHGWLDNAASFVPLAQHMDEHVWEAFDLSGHGRSAHKTLGAGDSYHVTDWALELCLLLEALGGPKRVLVGHSLGASLAGLVAAFAPERVAALICLDGLAPLSAPPESLVDRARTFLAEARSPRLNRVFPDFESLVATRAANGNMSQASARLLMERAKKTSGTTGTGVTIQSDVNLKRTSPLRLTFDHLTAVLARVECPTLVVDFGGAHFQRSAPEHTALLDSLQQGHVVSLPGGHHLHMDAPQEVAPVIKQFLSTLWS